MPVTQESSDKEELKVGFVQGNEQLKSENLPLKMRKVVCGRSSNQCSPLRRA